MLEGPASPSRTEHRIQEALARSLGVPAERRAHIVREMSQRHRIDAVSYWLQIVLATGIATYGLVLNSTGVVIGAMLISPLMGPIVGLGMGLAVGAPLLTLRSLLRVVASVVWVGGLAALLTVALPFHELTAEISARTSPTLLDLAVAVFCALAAGFTTARQSADTTSAAAGTAIGISLVPPLCVSGYGLGTSQWGVFGGALLLFTANFCAITFCSTLLFLGLGFNRVRVEDEDPEQAAGRGRFARVLHRVFGTWYGVLLRFCLPALLVAGVYVPLRAALGEVAWKVRVREEVGRMLRELAPEGRSVRTSTTVEAHAVHVRLALIGSIDEAEAVREQLQARIAAASGVQPDVHVTAVPDEDALRQIAAAVAAPAPAPPLPEPPRLRELQRRVAEVLATRWPASSGELLHVELGVGGPGPPTLTLTHTGAPIGPTAESLFADLLAQSLGEPVAVRGRALTTGSWRAEDPADFAADLLPALAVTREEPRLRACVTTPPRSDDDASVSPPAPRVMLERMLGAFAGPQVVVREGSLWTVELRLDGCTSVPAAPQEGREEPATTP